MLAIGGNKSLTHLHGNLRFNQSWFPSPTRGRGPGGDWNGRGRAGAHDGRSARYPAAALPAPLSSRRRSRGVSPWEKQAAGKLTRRAGAHPTMRKTRSAACLAPESRACLCSPKGRTHAKSPAHLSGRGMAKIGGQSSTQLTTAGLCAISRGGAAAKPSAAAPQTT